MFQLCSILIPSFLFFFFFFIISLFAFPLYSTVLCFFSTSNKGGNDWMGKQVPHHPPAMLSNHFRIWWFSCQTAYLRGRIWTTLSSWNSMMTFKINRFGLKLIILVSVDGIWIWIETLNMNTILTYHAELT